MWKCILLQVLTGSPFQNFGAKATVGKKVGQSWQWYPQYCFGQEGSRAMVLTIILYFGPRIASQRATTSSRLSPPSSPSPPSPPSCCSSPPSPSSPTTPITAPKLVETISWEGQSVILSSKIVFLKTDSWILSFLLLWNGV